MTLQSPKHAHMKPQTYVEPQDESEAGPNVDVKKWQDEQMDKATVRFSAKMQRRKVNKRSMT